MDKKHSIGLLKVRSSRACVGKGYSLYTDNFKAIFRYTFVIAVIYGLIYGAFGTYVSIKTPEMVMAQIDAWQRQEAFLPQENLHMLWPLPVLSVLMALVSCVCAGYVFALLRQHRQTNAFPHPAGWFNWDGHAIWRTCKATFFLFLVEIIFLTILTIPATLCYIYIGTREGAVCSALSFMLYLLLMFPTLYGWMKYILTDGYDYWRNLWSNYLVAMRYFGRGFIVVAICLITIGAAWFFTNIPAIILGIANMQAHLGVLYGDPLGMPGYIVPLTYCVFVIASFIQAYIHISILFPLYFLTGSIDAQEEGRKNQQWLKKQSQSNTEKL